LLDEQSQVSGGNISKVQTWEGGTGNNEYRDAITEECYSEKQIFPGDWLPTITGAGSGTSTNAVKELCNWQGSTNNPFPCDEVIRAVIYDEHNYVNGSNLEFHVKYIGVFRITGYDKGTSSGGGTPIPQVTGEFVALEMPGG